LTAPGTSVAGRVERVSLKAIKATPGGGRITSDESPVSLTVASGPGLQSGQVLASGTFRRGLAILPITFTFAGSYTLLASSPGIQSVQSVFTVDAARPVAMQASNVDLSQNLGQAPGVASFTVSLLDRFGNSVTSDDRSIIWMTAVTPANAQLGLLSAEPPFNVAFVPVVQRKYHGHVIYGVRLQSDRFGQAQFFVLSRSGFTGSVTLTLTETRPHIKPLSLTFDLPQPPP